MKTLDLESKSNILKNEQNAYTEVYVMGNSKMLGF